MESSQNLIFIKLFSHPINKCFLAFLFLLINFAPLSESKDQYVQPLNMGMQIAIPYDIANIFNRPVNFGPISGLLSAGCLLYILFFGVITSPFGYFFGVPSEKYVLGESWKTLPVTKEKTARIGTSFAYYVPQHFQEKNHTHYSYQYGSSQDQNHYGQSRNFKNSDENLNATNIDFETQLFSGKLGEEVKSTECRKMMVCTAHNGLRQVPQSFITGYQFFSKKLFSISVPYREAILDGIEATKSCQELYPKCNDSIFGILVRSLVKLMPKWSRKKSRRYQN